VDEHVDVTHFARVSAEKTTRLQPDVVLSDTGWQFEPTQRRLLGSLHEGSEEAVTFVIDLERALERFREQR
jgi:hypothetical protein